MSLRCSFWNVPYWARVGNRSATRRGGDVDVTSPQTLLGIAMVSHDNAQQYERGTFMKHCVAWMFVMAAGWAVALMAQIVTVATVDDHDKAMKTISRNARAVPALLEANALGDVTNRYIAIREQFLGVEGFWAGRKHADVAMLATNAIASVDAIIEAAEAADRPAIDAGIVELVAACAACHTKYREPDPATPNAFVIKTGVLQ